MADDIPNAIEGGDVVLLNDDQLAQMKIAELKMHLRQRNLRITGRKSELLERLKAAILLERDRIPQGEDDNKDENENEDNEDEEEDEDEAQDEQDEDSEEEISETPVVRTRRRRYQAPLTFRDVRVLSKNLVVIAT